VKRREDGITRRDFLEGVLLAAGGVAVAGLSPLDAFAHYPPGTSFPPDGSIGFDPRALRVGNTPSSFTAAHWLRDERLTWQAGTVKVAKSPVDATKGTFPILQDTGQYDLIVIGGGLSGLSTAFWAKQLEPAAKVLILEANAHVGGNASRDDASPALPTQASAATAYIVYPYDTFLFTFYDTIGVEYDDWVVTGPFRSHFFDSFMPPTSQAVWNGSVGWVHDTFADAGINAMPFPNAVKNSFQQAQQDFRNWFNRQGAPTDPPDLSDPQYDYLAHVSLRDYLVGQGAHPAVVDFYDTYASDCLAGTSSYCNAYSAISFIAAEYFDLCAFPGGNSYVTRRLLEHLIPNAIAGSTQDDILTNPILASELDKPTNQYRFRSGATGLRVDTGPTGAKVRYYKDGQFFEASCKAVVLAGQMMSSHRMAEHLVTTAQLDAMRQYWTVPSIVANVVVNNSQFLVNAGPAYDYYWYSGGVWQDCVMADYVKHMNNPAQLRNGARPNVLTVYDGDFEDPSTHRQEARVELHTQPFSFYEDALRTDLERVFGPSGFDWEEDVTALYLYRWGHGLNVPYVGWTFGVPQGSPPGRVTRTNGPRTIGRAQIGRISIAGQDSEGAPATEDAIYSGKRCVEEAAALL
jgi:spermidine dehydrogenase